MKKIFTLLTAFAMTASYAMAQTVSATWTLGEKEFDNVEAVTTTDSGLTGLMTKSASITGNRVRTARPSTGDIKLTSWTIGTVIGFQEDNYVDFTVTAPAGKEFTLSNVAFDMAGIKFGNGSCRVDAIVGNQTVTLTDVQNIRTDEIAVDNKGEAKDRDKNFNHSVACQNVSATDKLVVRFYLYNSSSTTTTSNREIGLANIVIEGNLEAPGVVLLDPELSFSQNSVSCSEDETIEFPALVNPNNLPVAYTSSDEGVATVNANGAVTVVGVGTTTIKAAFEGNETYKSGEATYTLSVLKSTPFSYIVSFGVEGVADQGVSIGGTTEQKSVTVGGVSFVSYDLKNAWGVDKTTNEDNKNYIMLTADGGFKTGDVITVKGVINSGDAAKHGAVKVYGDSRSNVLFTSGNFVDVRNNAEAVAEPVVFYLTEDATTLYIGRDGNTRTSVIYITVERPKVAVTAPVMTIDGASVDGTIDIMGVEKQISLSHEGGADIYYLYEENSAAEAAAFAAEPTMVHNGKTYTLYTEPITVSKAGKLSYFAHSNGVRSALGTLTVDNTTGIADIAADENAPVEYFNLMGVKVENPQEGLYIRRQGSKVEKVYVK